jgi:hypothetical protein
VLFLLVLRSPLLVRPSAKHDQKHEPIPFASSSRPCDGAT